MFKRNEGIIDRTLRVLLALVLLPSGLFWLGGLQGAILGLVVTGFSLLPLITGLTGFCPLYVPFGISTVDAEKRLMAKCSSMMAGGRLGNQSTGQTCCSMPQSMVKTPDE